MESTSKIKHETGLTEEVHTKKKKLSQKDITRIVCLILLGASALSTVAGVLVNFMF